MLEWPRLVLFIRFITLVLVLMFRRGWITIRYRIGLDFMLFVGFVFRFRQLGRACYSVGGGHDPRCEGVCSEQRNIPTADGLVKGVDDKE